MAWLLLIVFVIVSIFYYLYRTVALKKGVRYFVSAIVSRNNQWYEKEGRKIIDPSWTKPQVTKEQQQFWSKGATWTIETSDQLALTAKVFQQDSQKWVIVLHQYRSDGYFGGTHAAAEFFQKGYNVLVPDLRGHGESEGTTIGLGWLDRMDLILWIEKVIALQVDCQIVLYGQGMGAATVLLASGELLPQQVKVLIADSSYTSIYSVIRWQLPRFSKLPVKRFLRIANRFSQNIVGYPFLEISVTRQLGSNHLPVLFLHGQEDQYLPVSEVNTLMEATAGIKRLKVFKGMDHLEAQHKEAALYWEEIFQFLDENFSGKKSENMLKLNR